MTVVGTRPEIIRLSAVIKACDKYFNHVLVNRLFIITFILCNIKYGGCIIYLIMTHAGEVAHQVDGP